MPAEQVYAVCVECAHVEARPARELESWRECDECGEDSPHAFTSADEAREVSDDVRNS